MHDVKLQTYWADADPAGIVYFPHFFRFVEQAEEEIYFHAGTTRQSLLDEFSVWMPRVESHVKFVSPIRNGRAILVRLNPIFKGEKTVRFEFEIQDHDEPKLLASGFMTVVCVDRDRFKATPIPVKIRAVLAGHQ